MGRHRKAADSNGDIRNQQYVSSPHPAVEDALFGFRVCANCNARNPETAKKCRKCGKKELRKKADQYR